MITVQGEDRLISEVPDIQDVSFGADVNIDADERARIMRRIVGDGESGTSAGFNSSI
jgi:hypothetical protein